MLMNQTVTPNSETESTWETLLKLALVGPRPIGEPDTQHVSWYELHDLGDGYVSVEEG
jgi:hypothetical protein